MSNGNIEDQEEFNAVADLYRKLKSSLGEQDAKAAFASALFTERVQALTRDLPSLVETVIQKIESEQ